MENQKTNEEKYIDYVLEKIKWLQEAVAKLEYNISPEPHEVREVLARRVPMGLTLIGEKERARTKLKKLKRLYSVWWAEKFSEVRKELNPKDLPGTKYASKSDIDAETITRNKEEFIRKQEEIEEVESQFEFLKGVLDQWNGLQFDLANITKSTEMELNMYGSIKKPEIKTNVRIRS